MHTELILVTCGDPAGIGPELILRYFWLNQPNCRCKVICHRSILEYYQTKLKLPKDILDRLPILEPPFPYPEDFYKPTARTGAYSFEILQFAITTATYSNSCIITMPVSKELWQSAGINFAGHTEYFRHKFKNRKLIMTMGTTDPFIWVASLTDHVPLRKVPELITPDLIKYTAAELKNWIKKLGKKPKIAVTGMNPHAGEGINSPEESAWLKIILDLKPHMSVYGPFPADSFWGMQIWKQFNAVISPYHDQAFIPVKMLTGSNKGVHVTLGLPFLRLSPVHGTAFDLAGKGIANLGSFKECMQVATSL